MRAIYATTFGGPEVFRAVDVPPRGFAPVEQAEQAHLAVEERRVVGKTVLTP